LLVQIVTSLTTKARQRTHAPQPGRRVAGHQPLLFLVTRGGVTLLAGHTHQPDESDCGGLQHYCH
jgi:hypothetical protein